jgi:hypothetical protein
MVVFLMLKVEMARGKRLKKGGDLEAHKQHVVSSKQTIGKQNVAPLQSGLREKNVAPSEIETWGVNCCFIKIEN